MKKLKNKYTCPECGGVIYAKYERTYKAEGRINPDTGCLEDVEFTQDWEDRPLACVDCSWGFFSGEEALDIFQEATDDIETECRAFFGLP